MPCPVDSYVFFLTTYTVSVEPVLSGHSIINKTTILMTNDSLMKVESIAECSRWSILQYFGPALKESATNEKKRTVFVQDVSHNINLMIIGKWRRLNMISRRLIYQHSDFCLLESAAIFFCLVPVFVSALPGAREPGSRA